MNPEIWTHLWPYAVTIALVGIAVGLAVASLLMGEWKARPRRPDTQTHGRRVG